jgi:electron transfer flavoprotein beta subunit
MEIIVLLKQTFDTEEKIVITNGSIVEDRAKFVINPYDEYAVEQAIQLRDEFGGKVRAVSVGPNRSIEALRTALAMGVDEAVLISDDRISSDGFAVSETLASFISKQPFDLILAGNFSVDQGAGQVAIRLAHLLDIPHVASITKLSINNAKATANRDAEGDEEIIEVSLPALFTAQQGLNEPRYPSLQGIMKAKKKPFQELTLDDLGIGVPDTKTKLVSLSLPPERKSGLILSGELDSQVKDLVRLLRDDAKAI